VQAKLFGELAERFAGRNGGYTRVLRTRRRHGDAAEMSIVALLEAAPAAKAREKGEKAPRKKARREEGASRRRPSTARRRPTEGGEEGLAQEEVRQVRRG
jgi:large subunit ribosomal protein L17